MGLLANTLENIGQGGVDIVTRKKEASRPEFCQSAMLPVGKKVVKESNSVTEKQPVRQDSGIINSISGALDKIGF